MPHLGRRASLLAGLALMLSAGSNHALSAWNAQLQALLGYSQAEISLVGSLAAFGAYFSVAPGAVFDRVGAHRSVLLGGLLLSTAFLALYTGIEHCPEAMRPLAVGAVFAVVGQATNFGVFAALGPNEGLYGDANRGKIMALQFAGFSAGGALFALIYQHAFDGDVPAYFRFMAAMFLAVFAFAWLALHRPAKDDPELGIASAPEHALDEFMPAPMLSVDKTGPQSLDGYLVTGVDITGRALLADSRFWLLFSTVFILVGSSLFVMANIAFIVETRQGHVEQIPVMVSLFSVGNCSGRLVVGAVSDHVRESFPRAYFISLASVLVACIHSLFVVIPASWLVLPITLAGVADGVMFAAFPVLTRETFGSKHFGKNFGLMSVANAIGFPLFFNPLGSFFYRLSSTTTEAGVSQCVGNQCFRPVFLLVVVLSLASLAASLQFARRHQYAPLP